MKAIIVLVLASILVVTTGLAFKNECPTCKLVANVDDLLCKNCGKYINQCLICNHPNAVRSDSCEICCNPLGESRFLSSVSPDVRESYRLGQSPRAILDRENSQIQCFLKRTPEQESQLLFELGMNLKRMKFFAREADAWGEFLNKFPTSSGVAAAKIYRSEAFVNWGYLFFREGNLAEAENKFRSAVSENPQNVEAFVWLGRTNLAMGNVTEGRYSAKAALAMDPGDKRARYLLKASPRSIRYVPSVETEMSANENPGGDSQAANWFPEVSIARLK